VDPITEIATSGPLLFAAGLALLAGAISFASPCVVPLVPGYLAYMAALVGADAPAVSDDEGPKKGRYRVVGATGLFVLGFTASSKELTKFGRDGISSLGAGLTPLLVAGAFYLVITIPLSFLARKFESRSARTKR
jgi:cytochrome c biogenesis protein CcdA